MQRFELEVAKSPSLLPPVSAEFWKNKEYWRDALNDMCDAYGRICAFSAFRIETVTGSRSIEHFKPKSLCPSEAYEWTNYRLVCGLLNGRKKNAQDVLDPFEIPHDTFDVVATSGEIIVHRNCPAHFRNRAETTLRRLRPGDGECNAKRLEHIRLFLTGSPRIEAADSPFVHRCLQQQRLI